MSYLTENHVVKGIIAPAQSPTFTGTVTLPSDVRGWASNLLTVNQASLETDTTGWFVNSNVTLSRSTAQAADGAASLALTSAAAGNAYAMTGATVPVVGGRVHTAVASFRSDSVGRTCGVFVQWYTAALASISYSSEKQVVSTTTGWSPVTLTVAAPSNAAFCRVYLVFYSAAAAGEVHYVDKIGFWEGAGGEWALPGRPINALGTYTDESVGRRIFTWDTVNARWQMTYGDTGWRDVGGSLINGWTRTSAFGPYLRRVNNTIELQCGQFLDGTSKTANGFYAIPSGFRWVTMNYPMLGSGSQSGSFRAIKGDVPSGWYVEYASGTAATAIGSAMWTTADAWPTSLPGSAVGSIPT